LREGKGGKKIRGIQGERISRFKNFLIAAGGTSLQRKEGTSRPPAGGGRPNCKGNEEEKVKEPREAEKVIQGLKMMKKKEREREDGKCQRRLEQSKQPKRLKQGGRNIICGVKVSGGRTRTWRRRTIVTNKE